MRSVKGWLSQTNSVRSGNNAPNTCICILPSAVTGPWPLLPRALTEPCLQIRKSEPFVCPELPRGHGLASYFFCPATVDGLPPPLLSGEFAAWQLYLILLVNYIHCALWTSQVQAFFPRMFFCKRFQSNYITGREYMTTKSHSPLFLHFFEEQSSQIFMTVTLPLSQGNSWTDQ